MKLLIVAATRMEIEPLEAYLTRLDDQQLIRNHAIEIVITGAGGMCTAYHLGKLLQQDNWDLALNLGICGSLDKKIPLGTTVNVVADTFADLGAEDGDAFLDAFELQLMNADTFPFESGWIPNKFESGITAVKVLPAVRAITVNTVSGNKRTIERRSLKYDAAVESMEGAAFMWCCSKESIPFLQLRAVSNYVMLRDKNSWDMPAAIRDLNETAIKLLDEYLQIENR
ncbi:MAG: futalosine hydrolase [Chitinophagales bacterium]|nr:futalosine hydrolase [Chitinophagales bacterium]